MIQIFGLVLINLLNYFKLPFAQAFLVSDFIAIFICIININYVFRFLSQRKLFFPLLILHLVCFLNYIFFGFFELAFLLRMDLILLTALAILILKINLRTLILSIIIAAAILFFFNTLFGGSNFFYVSQAKSFAIFALLPLLYFTMHDESSFPNKRLFQFLALLFIVLVSFYLGSRTLLLGVILYLAIYTGIQNRFLFLMVIFFGLSPYLIFLFLNQELLFIESESFYSNFVRWKFVEVVGDFNFIQLIFGSGIEEWRALVGSDINDLGPRFRLFLSNANPHLLPIEIIIRMGLISLALFIYMAISLTRINKITIPAVVLIFCIFFTTTTGYERYILSMAMAVIIFFSRYEFNNSKI